jgi:hypothetical protein
MSLRKATIRLAYERPELRAHLLPLLARTAAPLDEEAMDMTAKGCTWGAGKKRQVGDKWKSLGKEVGTGKPCQQGFGQKHTKRDLGVPAGKNNSTQRYRYNEAYREQVCKTEPDKCGTPDNDWLDGQNEQSKERH